MGIIRFLALGAGQDVGRSCIIVNVGGKNIMFDCGMHMGYNDERRFPDFTLLSPTGTNIDKIIDCVIVTHFHLDHCGALPYLTEMCGYRGPIFMTFPTKALAPILLEDFRKIVVERKGELNFFTLQMIKNCLDRVKPLMVHQSYFLEGDDFEIKPYYAGHVLGAAMFYVRVGRESVVYTGDYNMTPDRHLGSAWIDLKLKPDVLITESTYATTLRDSKRTRERDFLRNVHQCVAEGGKVLIPVFALGRVQELCILIEEYWQRMGLDHIPVYFSAGMAEMANSYYRVFVDWTNEKLQNEYMTRNMFDFRHVRQFEKHYADHPGPMVLFSSPGMLHSGMSLEIFKKWCDDEKNLLIIPGFCVSGTVGAKILAGQRKIAIEEGNGITRTLIVKMQVKNMSFSAHADARGIMQLIKICEPRNVILVHGEAAKMAVLKAQIIREMGIDCYDPPNGQVLNLESSWDLPIKIDQNIIEERLHLIEKLAERDLDEESLMLLIKERAKPLIPIHGLVEWSKEEVQNGNMVPSFNINNLYEGLGDVLIKSSFNRSIGNPDALEQMLQREILPYALVERENEWIVIRSVRIHPASGEIRFKLVDYDIAQKCVGLLEDSL